MKINWHKVIGIVFVCIAFGAGIGETNIFTSLMFGFGLSLIADVVEVAK